jgi:tight adherence protein B
VKFILIGVAGLTFFVLLEALAYTLRFLGDRKKDELKRRLSALGSGGAGPGQSAMGVLRMGKLAVNPAIDAMLRSLKVSARLENLLEQTELEMTVASLLAYMMIGAILGFMLAVIGSGGIMFVILPLLFGLLPLFFVLFKRNQRSTRLSQQLPDALEMMARSLRAGHALSSSFKMVATEMPTPVSVEFGRAFESQELGMPFEKAVADMTRRAPDNQDLKIFALSVIVQKETGGNLVEIIEKIADTVRGREKFQGKLRGLTAEGRMSSYILGALPFLSLLFMLFGNRDYLMPMFTEDVGHYVLGYGIISWVIGFLWMRKMIKVKM